MKFLFLLLLSLSLNFSQAQFFSSRTDWFENESFFLESAIKKHKIEAVHIWTSEKLDGKYIQAEKSFIHYLFNSEGKLSRSYKAIPLKNRVDTAMNILAYNEAGKIILKQEKQGPFNFDYHYFYEDDLLFKEIKIDRAENRNDTNFIHYFKYQKEEDQEKLIVLNTIKKPFSYLTFEYNKDGNLIREKTGYFRNQNYSETNFYYENGQIIKKTHKPLSTLDQKVTTYEYKQSKLELVTISKNEQVINKYGFTYDEKGLPDAIIERDLINKKIIIYRIEYLFRD